MVFVKLVKNKAYFKRYQTKFRRRREGKTDYQQRKALTVQDNNKYNCKKYRFVVRITNTRIICQIAYATLQGDKIMCQAQSSELKKFGLTAGLTNYPAAYCTGLLLARRLLQSLGMDTLYKGCDVKAGKYDSRSRYDITRSQNVNLDRRPFKALLDVGLQRTTTGSRVFGALKGACDGGLHIPHHTRRFPGSNKKAKRKAVKYNAETHSLRIYGSHVESYLDAVEEKDEAEYERRFKRWSKCIDDNSPKKEEEEWISYADLYKQVHKAIRADPSFTKKPKGEQQHPVLKEEKEFTQRVKTFMGGKGKKYKRARKLTLAERKQNVNDKINADAAMKQLALEEAEESGSGDQ